MSLAKTLMLVPAAAVAFGVSLGAQKSEKATGIPECDKYFALVDACVATKKMSKEEQQAAEFNANRLRAMLPIAATPQGRATLAQRCAASIEIGRKNDKHGCYASADKDDARLR